MESKRKWYEWTYLQKRKRLTDLGRLRKWIYDCQQRGGIVTDFWKVIYTLLCLKWITNKDVLCSTWNSAQCYLPDWMGAEFGWVPLLFTWNYHNTVNWLCAVLSLVSHVWLFVTPCTIAYHASLWSLSRQGYWSGLPCPPPGDPPNPVLPHCRSILYHLSHHGSPRMLEWVAYPFSRASSPPRNWTRLSYTAGGFITRGSLIGHTPTQSKKFKFGKNSNIL